MTMTMRVARMMLMARTRMRQSTTPVCWLPTRTHTPTLSRAPPLLRVQVQAQALAAQLTAPLLLPCPVWPWLRLAVVERARCVFPGSAQPQAPERV